LAALHVDEQHNIIITCSDYTVLDFESYRFGFWVIGVNDYVARAEYRKKVGVPWQNVEHSNFVFGCYDLGGTLIIYVEWSPGYDVELLCFGSFHDPPPEELIFNL
jgi:hypothetical protein